VGDKGVTQTKEETALILVAGTTQQLLNDDYDASFRV
jgi:hypothetical protein